jgi:hypothetical protein
MIELEIQALSEKREGLLIDVGRCAVASGFTLQKQRLAQDDNGVLLTMVVRGPERKQRVLEAALEAHERVISFEVSPFVEGASKPHFAASPPPIVVRQDVAPAPAPTPAPASVQTPAPAIDAAPVVAPAVVMDEPAVSEAVAAPVVLAAPKPQPEPEPEFVFIMPTAPSPAPAAAVLEPFVEVIPIGPDEDAVEKVLPKLTSEYPEIFPRLLKLEDSVVAAARESSLMLAGQRTGAWVFERDYASGAKLSLREAIANVGIPALHALVEVEQQGEQLHIRNSPLCMEDGHSGCKFFSGYLEGLLSAAIGTDSLSIFAVCCRSCGAGECILAISD